MSKMLKHATLNNILAQLNMNKEAEAEEVKQEEDFMSFVNKLAEQSVYDPQNPSAPGVDTKSEPDAYTAPDFSSVPAKEQSISGGETQKIRNDREHMNKEQLKSQDESIDPPLVSDAHDVKEVGHKGGLKTAEVQALISEAIEAHELKKQAELEKKAAARKLIEDAFNEGVRVGRESLGKTAQDSEAAAAPAPEAAPMEAAPGGELEQLKMMILEGMMQYASNASAEQEMELMTAIKEVLESQGQDAAGGEETEEAAPQEQAPAEEQGMNVEAGYTPTEDQNNILVHLNEQMKKDANFKNFVEGATYKWVESLKDRK